MYACVFCGWFIGVITQPALRTGHGSSLFEAKKSEQTTKVSLAEWDYSGVSGGPRVGLEWDCWDYKWDSIGTGLRVGLRVGLEWD